MQKQTKMLQFRRTFENEQIQLQDLNTRLRQYLSRVKELEQDNALLMKEINTIRQDKTVQWEKQYLPELRELRRVVNQLTLEKYKAEMDREKLGRELQAIQALCCEETVISRDIEGERKGCEIQLQQALKKNAALEEHLLQLENEYMCLQDAHRQDISHLRDEVHSRALPIVITQNYQGHPAVTMEEIEAYAHMMSETLNENFELYCRRIEVLEDSIKADQANLEDLQREKTQYASELKKLHAEAHKQNKLQLHLEDQLIQLQDQFHLEADRYQAIIGELEDERELLAHTIAEKLKEYQQLMQVKMGLGLEVATYRALLEGERTDPIQKMDQYAREASRRIDIKMPSQPWSTTTRQEVQKQYPLSTGPEARYTNLASSLKASFGSTNMRSTSPARVIPISTHARDQRNAPVRRDIPSFTRPSQATTNVQKTTVEDRSSDDPDEAGSSDEKMVDYIYMEEIIEKVMRPAGLDTKFINPSPDSKVAYRVEKTEDEDGKTKTQIILESRVEEDVDITDDSALQELLGKGVKKVSLEDIKGTPTGSAIENLLSLGHHVGGSDLEHKSVNVEIIEEPAEDHGDEEGEANPAPTFLQPSSMFFQIEELDNDSHGAKHAGGKTEVSKPTPTEDTEYQKEGSVWVREGYRETDDPFFSHAQETEYFVSTPDDSISESEEERGISSYGHYGVLDDLSDERYYQEVPPINPRFEEDKGYKSGHRGSYMTSELGFAKDRFPECIIEEEVQVSPTVQESMLDHLTEDSMDPKQQLRGDLDKLQGNVFESLQGELSHATKNVPAGPKKLSVDVKKVQEVSDNGTVTITAELRDLEYSDLLEDSESDKRVQASSHPGLQHATGSKAVREYAVKIIRDQDEEPLSMAPTVGLDGPGLEGLCGEESANDIHKTERVIKLGPSERSLTFQMDIGNFGSATSLPAEGGAQEFQRFFSQSLEAGGPSGGEGVYTYVRKTTVSYDQGDEPTYSHGHEGEARKWDDLTKQQVEYGQVLQTQFVDPQLKVNQEKKIATVYLDSTEGN
ncbi:hypothetical protein ANANG_G00208260 [Anguilla anguilla]|uniref:IF rod domain-containing protein n=1 Tax=Anguilla anguilla TaxID=7936 RepID=A0A9D3LZ97_ANGAN|nr:hypothetical protein ANANG_G00208260 [Anguilla anguilla]